MENAKSLTNESFNFLRNSSTFLNIILNSMTTCVLLLDNGMKLQAFNNVLKTIFSNKRDEDLLYMRCGEAIGCAFQIEEGKECGKTSKCCNCDLRESAITSYLDDVVIYKESIIRPFFDINHKKVEKNLQFSTRLFHYSGEKYIILLIDDISKYVNPEKT